MTSRTTLLLLLMGGVALVRWLVPPQAETPEIVAAVDRQRGSAASAPMALPQIEAPTSKPSEAGDADTPGNAFEARVAKAPPVPTPPPATPVVATAPPPMPTVAPTPAPPPPSPFQVIGTWDDGAAAGVFLSSPTGALFARAGTTLMSQYRVTHVTAQQVSIVQTSTQHEWQLPIPRTSPR